MVQPCLESAQLIEDSDIDGLYGDCPVKLKSNPTTESTCAKKDPELELPTQCLSHDFVPFPPHQANKCTFPPGARVVICRYNGAIDSNGPSSALLVSQVLHGKVRNVGASARCNQTVETLYQVVLNDKASTMITTGERDIQLAIGAPVWIRMAETDMYRPAVVVQSQHFPVFNDDPVLSSHVMYSVQALVGNCMVYHGLLMDHLIYRSSARPPKFESSRASSIPKVPPKATISLSSATVLVPSAEAPKEFPSSQTKSSATTEPILQQRQHADTNEKPIKEGAQLDLDEVIAANMEQTKLVDNASHLQQDKCKKAKSLGPLKKRALVVQQSSRVPSVSPNPPRPSASGDQESNQAGEISTQSSSLALRNTTRKPVVLSPEESSPERSLSFISPKPTERSLLSEFTDAAKKVSPLPNDASESGTNWMLSPPNSKPSMRRAMEVGALAQFSTSRVSTNKLASLLSPRKNRTVTFGQVRYHPHPDSDSNTRATEIPKGTAATTDSAHKPRSGIASRPKSRAVPVFNRDPSPFQFIKFGVEHQVNVVLRELRTTAAKDMLDQTCLKYQIIGSCWEGCKRQQNHVKLTLKTTALLEDALGRWIGQTGPIFCQPASSTSDTMNRFRASTTKCKLYFHAVPREASFHQSIHASHLAVMYLPVCFGEDLIVDTIIGKDGATVRELCDMFSCSIKVEGLPTSHTGSSPIVVQIKASSSRDLDFCRFAIENALFRATPWHLRALMLYDLADTNNYRYKKGKIVRTLNPHAKDHSTCELQHVTIIRASRARGATRDGTDMIKQAHPNCQIELIKRSSAWPSICAHFVITGLKFKDVQKCRDSTMELMKHGRSPRKGQHKT
ncbi:expressed unknown protein [Seminavis robusta]|uniref:K Homology domain-containing protein n=1 Tax=Seminavis robusta TaxID=568900 RepID=A0A9N8ELB8_9STRA|nr:expressed unknown protein [Seminavis robusta]|eukprot:Sro1387_g268370.1 n/a (848) ;mRNA; f:15650-18193